MSNTNETPKSMDEWLADAPMPYDIRFAGPSTETKIVLDANGQPIPAEKSALEQTADCSSVPSSFQQPRVSYNAYSSPASSEFPSNSVSAPPPDEHYPFQPAPQTTSSEEGTSPVDEQPHIPEKPLMEVRTEEHELIPEVRVEGEIKPWCIVHYLEYKERKGNPYNASEHTFVVDGTTPNSDASHLAISAQPVSKQPKCSQIRNQLGAGFSLSYKDGNAYLKVHTDQALFVQCAFLKYDEENPEGPLRLKNTQEQCDNGDGIQIELFNKDRFAEVLKAAEQMTFEEAYDHLQTYCAARISFCKGYGNGYKNRTIIDNPCWVEIHFTEPYELTDTYLRSCHRSPVEIHSWS